MRVMLYTMDMIEFSERVTIPDRCKRCVTLARLASLHDMVSRDVDEMTEAGLSGKITQDLIDAVVHYEGISHEEAAEFIASKQPDITEDTVHMLDKMDEVRDTQVNLGQRIVDACPDGVLSMRARRNGHEVVVRVCMSSIREVVPNSGKYDAEIVGIERRATED